MKFQDLFVPRWQHSNPGIRKKAVAKLKDKKLLRQIAEQDDDPLVRETAQAILNQIHTPDKMQISEQD